MDAKKLNCVSKSLSYVLRHRPDSIGLELGDGKPVLLAIDAKRMAADGHAFFVTGNHVWLTERVPPEHLEVVD